MSYPRFSCALYMFPPSFFSPILSLILSRRNKVVKSQKGRPRTTKIDTKIAKKKAALGRLKLNANGFCRGTIFPDSPKSGRDRIGQVFCPAGLIGFRFGPKVGRRWIAIPPYRIIFFSHFEPRPCGLPFSNVPHTQTEKWSPSLGKEIGAPCVDLSVIIIVNRVKFQALLILRSLSRKLKVRIEALAVCCFLFCHSLRSVFAS